MKKLYTANCNTLGFENYKPVGQLMVDYSLDDLSIKNYYIREYYFENFFDVKYNDFKIDATTLVDITDYDNPVAIGIDLTNGKDITYLYGEYYINDN